MANTFKATSATLNGTLTEIISVTAAHTFILQSVYVTNVGGVTCNANVAVSTDAGVTDRYVAYNAEIPVGQTLVLDKPIVLEASDTLDAEVSPGSAHIVISYLDQG